MMLKKIPGLGADRSELNQALTLGLNFAVGMAVFSFAGYAIDRRRGEDCLLFTVLGMGLGLGYGAYEVWKVIRVLNRQAEEACRRQGADTQGGAVGGGGNAGGAGSNPE